MLEYWTAPVSGSLFETLGDIVSLMDELIEEDVFRVEEVLTLDMVVGFL